MTMLLMIFLTIFLMSRVVKKSKRNLYLCFFSRRSVYRRRTNSSRLISLHLSFRRRRHRRESSVNSSARSLVSFRRESLINSKRRHRRRQRSWCSINSSHQFALLRRRQEINSNKRFRNSISYLRKQRSFSYREKSQSKTKSLTQASRTSKSRDAKVKLSFFSSKSFFVFEINWILTFSSFSEKHTTRNQSDVLSLDNSFFHRRFFHDHIASWSLMKRDNK